MRRRPWRLGIASSAIVLSIAVPILNTAGSLAQDRTGSGTKGAVSPAARLPVNYRQLMAQYIQAHNRYVIRDAMISRPYERWGGLLRGGLCAGRLCGHFPRQSVRYCRARQLGHDHGERKSRRGTNRSSNLLRPFSIP